ncbi:MAG: DUF3316 domain-containing protein [Bacteroidales bacterium]|nr:DUF3316 domain-containing protein [Bacteroidales bacterium]
MKKTLKNLLLTLSLCSNAIWIGWAQEGTEQAQDADGGVIPAVQRPVTSSVMFGVGGTTLHDTYLTNQLYDGTSLNLSLQRVRLMKHGRLEKDQWFDLSYATTTQEVSDANQMLAFRVRYSYAMHVFRDWEHSYQMRSHLFAGLCAMYNIGANYNLSMGTGNNPANMHQTMNLGLSAGYQWDFSLRRRPGDVRLTVQTPLLGGAFSPEFAQSYYTMYTYGDPLSDNYYFTSWHRQQDLDVRLTSDIPIRAIFPLMDRYNTALRVGVNYHIETQKINHLITRYSYCQVVLGWTWQHVPYKGKRL